MAQTTRLTIMQRVAPMLGGYQGSITSGTATTIVADGLVGAVNDDDLNDDLLVMPDAATAADTVRIIADTTGTTGTLTFAARADTTYTSETYFTIPKNTFTLQECRQAVSETLRHTKRTYRYVVPSMDYQTQYPLSGLSWLRDADDVDGVLWRPSPGINDNEHFDRWDAGTTSAPDSLVLAGAGGTIARTSSFSSRGAYAAQITRSGADVTLTYTVPFELARQMITNRSTIAVEVGCQASVASRAYAFVNDGSATYGTPHTGGSNYEAITASLTLSASSTGVSFGVAVRGGDTSAIFDYLYGVEESSVPDSLSLQGSSGYTSQDIRYQILNIGSAVPMLALPSSYSRKGQFVIVTRRPYADLTTDAASTEAPSDVIEAGVLYHLSQLDKPSMDQARQDRMAARWGPVYNARAGRLIDKPVQQAQTTMLVRGA